MILHLARCTVDLDRRRLTRADGTAEVLGSLDADVLRFLAESAGEVVTYDALLTRVWGFRAEHPRGVVQVQMSRLRTLIGDDPRAPVHLFTVRGSGYRLRLLALPEEDGAVPRAIVVIRGLRRLPAQVLAQDGELAVAAFPDVPEAVAWLTEAAREAPGLAAGLHHGLVVRGRGTLGGAAVHVARLVARLARAGSILATRPARERHPAAGWRAVGTWRLPEIGRAETLWRWATPGSVDTGVHDAEPVLRSDLPVPATPFVGRGDEMARLAARLEEASLVTLVGHGGLGKTRLALEVARRRAGPTIFLDLTEVRSLADLAETAAGALGLRAGSDADEQATLARVGGALAELHDALVVLDSAESALDAVHAAVAAWLPSDARLLVTSRRPLGHAGETLYPLGPLSLADGVALLQERASALEPSFDGDPDVLLALVAAVDAIPLALELLARRARVLSPRALLDRLRARRPGHLEAVLAWSWEQLEPAEREVLAGLSVFRGGFTAGAVEEVLDRPDVLDRLVTLRDLAWVQGTPFRLRLLDTVAAFVANRLEPEARRALEERHARWAVALAERLVADLDRPGRTALVAERTNLAAARGRLAATDPELSARALLAEIALVRHHGGSLPPLAAAARGLARRLPPGGTRDRLQVACAELALTLCDAAGVADALAAVGDAPAAVRAEAEMVWGQAAYTLGRGPSRASEAAVHYAAAREAFAAANDPAGAFRAGYRLAYSDFLLGRYAEALAGLKALLAGGPTSRIQAAETWIAVGRCHGRLGAIDEAMAAFENAAAEPEEAIGHLAAEAAVGMAWVHAQRGRWDRAIAAYERVLVLHRRYDDRLGEAACLNDLADVARQMGDLDRAEAGYLEALGRYRALGTRDHIVRLNLALVHLRQGRDHEARRTLDALIEEGPEPIWAAAAHVLCLPAAAGDTEDWLNHHDAAVALLDQSGFVHEDLATVCELAARRATDRRRRDQAAQAWSLAARQWDAMGEAEAARRARHAAR